MDLVLWRHPKPKSAEGMCLGQSDLDVDPRRLRRLGYRILKEPNHPSVTRLIYVSPLKRSRKVGYFLQRLGWQVRVEPALAEFDFGHWDGRPWEEISPKEMDAWCNDFADYAPGDGESLRSLFNRVENWLKQPSSGIRLVVGHAGWINAARMISQGLPVPKAPSEWPSAPHYGQRIHLSTKDIKINSLRLMGNEHE